LIFYFFWFLLVDYPVGREKDVQEGLPCRAPRQAVRN
jgi:hypothetical protein